MQFELSGIPLREKILSQPWINNQERNSAGEKKAGDENAAMMQADNEQFAVPQASPFKCIFKLHLPADKRVPAVATAIETTFFMHLQQVLRHGRHHSARQKIGGEHSENNRLTQRNKEILGHAPQEEHR